MSKQKSVQASTLIQEVFQLGVYKRTQGKIARQITFVALLIGFALAAYSLSGFIASIKGMPEFASNLALRYTVPFLLLTAGAWLSYRLVNYHVFADFLIAVEAEMNKVSWPSKAELVRSSLVVLFVIFGLMVVLYGFDAFWFWLFRFIGVLR